MNRAVVCFVLGVCIGLLIGPAHAEDITFSMCKGQIMTFKQPKGTDKLQVFCPGKPDPVFTIQGCVGPRVKKSGSDYTVTCTRFIEYTPGVPVVK